MAGRVGAGGGAATFTCMMASGLAGGTSPAPDMAVVLPVVLPEEMYGGWSVSPPVPGMSEKSGEELDELELSSLCSRLITVVSLLLFCSCCSVLSLERLPPPILFDPSEYGLATNLDSSKNSLALARLSRVGRLIIPCGAGLGVLVSIPGGALPSRDLISSSGTGDASLIRLEILSLLIPNSPGGRSSSPVICL